MPTFKLAHLREQGQNMLLFPLDSSFENKTEGEQSAALAELEMRAHGAGLAGRAAAVWQYGGRTRFIGPRNWQNFLRSISLNAVLRNVNKSISW